MHRLFVAIRPPEDVRDTLIDAMDESPDLHWVGDDNLHLTLRFIGEVDRPLANDVADALCAIRFPAFALQIAGVGRFDRRSGGALWAGVSPARPVAELAAKVDRACAVVGLEPEHQSFHPHVTLARYGRRGAEAARNFEQRHSDLSSGRFEVVRFILFESRLSKHGAHYSEIASIALP